MPKLLLWKLRPQQFVRSKQRRLLPALELRQLLKHGLKPSKRNAGEFPAAETDLFSESRINKRDPPAPSVWVASTDGRIGKST